MVWGAVWAKSAPAHSDARIVIFSKRVGSCSFSLTADFVAFPTGHHGAGQAIAEHVDRGAGHIEQGVHPQPATPLLVSIRVSIMSNWPPKERLTPAACATKTAASER